MAEQSLDINAQFEGMKKALKKGLQDALQGSAKKYKIKTDDIIIGDADPFSLKDQRDTKLKGKTWGVPVTWKGSLVDPKGNVIKSQQVKLFDLPAITPRGSYIVNGTEFQVNNQFRLRPGVYTRIKNNGEIESAFNLAKGWNFRLRFDPESLKFKAKFGTANFDLYPIIKALGATDTEIEQTLGREIYLANTEKVKYGKTIKKLYRLLFRGTPPDDLSQVEKELQNYFKATKIDTTTTQITLGQSHGRVSASTLLRTAKKLLDVNRGEEEPDDRDEMRFKRLMTPDDLLEQRIESNAHKIKRRINFKLSKEEEGDELPDLRKVIGPSKLERMIMGMFNSSRLAQVPEQINPMEMISNFGKTTVFGEGGISDRRAVTLNARNVTPTQFGFVDPVHTPEGQDIGTTTHLTMGLKKEDDEIKTQVIDVKSKKRKWLSPVEAFEEKIAFPDQYETKGGKLKPKNKLVTVFYKGEVQRVPPKEVNYMVPSASSLFDPSANSLPFLPSLQGNRAMMASKHLEQALSLKDREKPLVQVQLGDQKMDDLVGQSAQTIPAKVSGKVTKITKDEIIVTDSSGKEHTHDLYNNFPLNGKSYVQSEPLVTIGQKVKKGDLLADSNYTRDGSLTLGTNLRVAYLPAQGYNFEDGIVISETASKKLTSNHLYQFTVDKDKSIELDKQKWVDYYGQLYTKDLLQDIDSDGLIKEGVTVQKGQPLALVLQKRELTPEDVLVGTFRKSLAKNYANRAIEWEEEVEGTVTDVVRKPTQINILVRTEEPAVVGDKMSSRHAAKGIITRILPDNEMPHTEDGKPAEVLLNPHGVPSRMNPSQVLEIAAAKVAEKRGEPFMVENFKPQDKDNLTDVKNAMKSYGVKDKEKLIDPVTETELGEVAIGPQYVLKLDHPVRKKFSARSVGVGNPYTSEGTPAQGKDKSGQSIDHLTLYSIMAHGANENLKEMATYKASRNSEFWRDYMAFGNFRPPEKGIPWEKFQAYMKGMGVRINKEGSDLRLVPMTDDEISTISNGAVTNPSLLVAKNLKPEPGGLFDPVLTGGLKTKDGTPGEKWSHIELSDPIPNPVFEKAVRTLLDLKGSDYKAIISGKKSVTDDGKVVSGRDGAIGGEGIKKLLEQIDPEKDLKKLRKKAQSTTDPHKLNKLNKKIRFLHNWVESDFDPDNFLLRKLPVVPPKYRPIYPLSDGNLITSDLNYLYRDAILLNEEVGRSKDLPPERQYEKRTNMYDAAAAVMGLGDPVSQRSRNYRGIFEQIKGKSPKRGWYQSRLVKRRQDLTGRSTITPDPTLHVDEVGVPEEMSWKIFEPFIIRDLVSQGMTMIMAKKEVEERTLRAKEARDRVAEKKHVFLNRSPSLHKHSFLAHKPKIVNSQSIKIHPLVVSGYNADFDGDTMAVHVPISDRANDEARNMLPSQNMFSTRESLLTTPSQEMQIGLYLMTKGQKTTNKSYSTEQEALDALERGEIRVSDFIRVGGKQTTAGRIKINELLPPKLRKDDIVLDKSTLRKILTELAKNNPGQAAGIIDSMKDLGNKYSYNLGFSIGIDDLIMDVDQRDQVVGEAERQAEKIPNKLPREKREQRIVEIFSKARNKLEDKMKKNLEEKDSSLFHMANSGARGNWDQVRQVSAAPMLYSDAFGNTLPYPVTKSFSEGLDVPSYWNHLYGARTGMIEKGIQTAEPGALSKSIIGTTINNVVSQDDCGTDRGINKDIDDDDVLGRYLAKPSGNYPKNTLVTDEIVNRLKEKNVQSLIVRSPLYCEAAQGTCAKCFGTDEQGRPVSKGANIGVISAQGLTEPLTQMSMNSFHTGGIAKKEKDVTDNFSLIRQLFTFPGTFRNKAPLAQKSGKVEKIDKAPGGGWNVYIQGQKHFVPQHRDLQVSEGDKVIKGDQLSDGLKDPSELIQLRGPWETREYVAGALQDIYKGSGLPVPAKHFETVTRSTVGTTRVLKGDEEGQFLEGDIAPLDKVMNYNLNNLKKTPVKNALGHALGEDVKEIGGVGKILDEDDLTELAKRGYSKIKTNPRPVVHQPVLKGVDIIPRTRGDWLSHLAFRYLKEVAERGVAEGWKSDISGFHPLPAQVYGSV